MAEYRITWGIGDFYYEDYIEAESQYEAEQAAYNRWKEEIDNFIYFDAELITDDETDEED